MLIFRPQPITHARLQPPGPARALGSAGSGNALSVETGHAAARIEARHPRQPGIDHDPNTINGQAGLRDIGRQYHLAHTAGRGLDGGTLGGQVQLAMQRAKQDVTA